MVHKQIWTVTEHASIAAPFVRVEIVVNSIGTASYVRPVAIVLVDIFVAMLAGMIRL